MADRYVYEDVEGRRAHLQSVLPDYGKIWMRVPHLLKLNVILFLCTYVSSTNNGFDGSILNGFQSMTQWEEYFGSPNGAILGVLATGYTFGVIPSLPIIPWFMDKFGRKIPIATSAAIIIIGAIIQTGSQGFGSLLVGRIVIGFGAGLGAVCAPILVAEVSYPTHRHLMTVSYNTLWYLGAIEAAWTTYGTYWMKNTSWSWRIPSAMQGFFPLIQLLTIYFAPESPRYLVNKDRVDEARAVLIKWHANGDASSQLVEYEMEEICITLQLEKTTHKSSYSDFLKSRANMHRLFIVIMLPLMQGLSGNGVIMYFLNKVLDTIGYTTPSQQLLINGCLQIYLWVWSVVLSLFCEIVGRRPMFLASFGGMFITYIIWTVLSARFQETGFSNHSLSQGVLAMIFLFEFCYTLGLSGLPPLYFTEILPYHLRAKGISIFQMSASVAAVYNGFVNPIALEAIGWKYYIVYCCLLAVELAIAYFSFPETKGRTLENVAEVFGDDAAHEKLELDHVETVHHDEPKAN